MTLKMSQTKPKRKYITGMISKARILRVLALNEEFSQYDLPKKIDRHYRQVIRCLQELRDQDLISLKRTEQSEKGGKEKNIWGITFYGLMEILKLLEDEEIDLVAYRHRDKWLIFAEWSFLVGIHGKIFYRTIRAMSNQFNSLETTPIRLFTESEVKQMGYTPEQWQKQEKEIGAFVLECTRQDYTDQILGLSFLKDRRKLKFLWKKLGNKWLRARSKILAFYSKNPRIKKYIKKRFEQQMNENSLVEKLETQWKGLTSND